MTTRTARQQRIATREIAAVWLSDHIGRVLAITGVADSLDEAQRLSQECAEAVRFEGKQFRSDIAWREMARRAGAT